MIERVLLCRTACTDPYRNLAVEEHLMETVPEGACILYLWQNRRTVVIGRNQNPWKECRTGLLEAEGGHLARRLSGGGAVFHDLGNLNFTFLVRQADYDVPKQMKVIVEACRLLGIPAECSGRNDVFAGGRKFSGNAFYRRGENCYHHGTILVDVDAAMMGRYLSPSKAKLQAKGVASVRARVGNLKELKPELTVSAMALRMEEAFQAVYSLPAEQLEEPASPEIDRLAARNGSWVWRYGRKMDCTFSCGERFSWGELDLRLRVEEGLVVQAAADTDALDWTLAPALEEALTGQRFCLKSLQEAIRQANLDKAAAEDLCHLLEEQM